MTRLPTTDMELSLDLIDGVWNAGVWIDGGVVDTGDSFEVRNPASGEVISAAPDADRATMDAAIDAAHRCFGTWRAVPAGERAALIRSWADVIEGHRDDLAAITTAESGKLFREARGEVDAGVAALRWAADMALRPTRTDLPAPTDTKQHYTVSQPVGVVACITPWNFPIAAVLVKVGAAIAAGCTVVVKPSEETPLVALALASLSAKVEMPNGVINVVTTSKPEDFGAVLSGRDEVRAVSFTGSTAVGKHLYGQCAGTMKRLSLELGGNAPFVVFADADIDRAIDDAINARFYNSGQICVGANRFFIHADVYDEFKDGLAARVSMLVAGDGFDETSDLGPLINRRAKDHFTALLTNAVDAGATVLAAGAAKGSPDQAPENLFVAPTVLTNVDPSMDVYTQEIFGPLACLYSFDDCDDVVALANDTTAGLAAYAYSENHSKLVDVGARLEAGVVGLNTTQIFASDLPFGGTKESGFGREHGEDCLEEFLELKSFSQFTGKGGS